MSSPNEQPRSTLEEYFEIEAEAFERHEFIDSQIHQKAGINATHSIIQVNLVTGISTQLKGKPCATYSPNMKVCVSPKGTIVYPDVTVVCGPAEFFQKRTDTLTNPTLIVEVLSPSTENYDRGEKWIRYQEMPSLREYVIVAQDAPRIERFFRKPEGGWFYESVSGLENMIRFESIDCVLPLADVFDRIEFPPAAEDEGILEEPPLN
jgi:Uma2 family endonuclease